MDLLNMGHINSLPHPLMARVSGWDWQVHDIEVQTGLLRILVSGLTEVLHIGDVLYFTDSNGVVHDAESFYAPEVGG